MLVDFVPHSDITNYTTADDYLKLQREHIFKLFSKFWGRTNYPKCQFTKINWMQIKAVGWYWLCLEVNSGNSLRKTTLLCWLPSVFIANTSA